MADVDIVRLLIGDRKKAITREVVTNAADGVQATFQLDMYPIISGAAGPSAVVALWVSGITAATTTYTLSGDVGLVYFTPTAAGPLITAGASIYADYSYHTLSSGEITEFLSGHTGSPLLAAANACLTIAADYSRLGVYVQGNKSVRLDKVADNLIELSKNLENKHYRQRDDTKFSATVVTFKDDTGTVYEDYDTAVAYYTGVS